MKRARTVLARVATALASAYLWYVLLALVGATCAAYGVALEFGRGYGLIAFGVLCVVGSELIRGGMRRG